MSKQPNIVLIMTDQMRGDCMSGVGHPDVKTPNLDTLIASGTLFPNAYTACPSCIPARAALMTGLSQKNHGRVGYQDRIPWNYDTTLAGELAKASYYTQCVGKMHVHPIRNSLDFHNIELHDGYLHTYRVSSTSYSENQNYVDDYLYWLKNEKGIDTDVIDTGLECNSWVARPWPYEEKYHPTNWATTRSIDFLRRRDQDKPFFLMTSYVRPHAPYDAPQVYFDMYKDKQLAPPVYGDWNDHHALDNNCLVMNNFTGPKDPELIRQQQVGYYACITHIDHQIGRLIQALREHNVYDNTVIIFTSDHGELLSDHCLVRKVFPYQGSVKIPMIMKTPFSGRKVNDSIVELRDIMPTTIEVAGGDTPANIDGISMLSDDNQREYLHGEHSFGDMSNHYIVTKTDKFCWFSKTGKEQYFDLEKDPTETHNAIDDDCYKQRIELLKSYLIKELYDREEGYSDGEQLIVGKQSVACLSHIRVSK